jgi:D-beta-D-heptose 7-phosphate kinase/D-beta-D-heptose 1-phosphate adenosyltransferase
MGIFLKNVVDLEKNIAVHKECGKSIVMVNGCFDLFHAGHLDLLRMARTYGDILVVCINSDESVKKNKSDWRPVVTAFERATIVSAIVYVDLVIIFDEAHPGQIISAIKPDYIVKESEYRKKTIMEIDFINECECSLVFYDKSFDVSTTSIMRKIVESYSDELIQNEI